MKLVKWDLNAIDNCYMAPCKNQVIINEFIESGMECAKVEGWIHKTASGCATALNSTIKNNRYHGVKAITRKGEVYLLKTK